MVACLKPRGLRVLLVLGVLLVSVARIAVAHELADDDEDITAFTEKTDIQTERPRAIPQRSPFDGTSWQDRMAPAFLLEHAWFELVVTVVLLLVGAQMRLGRGANVETAKQWIRSTKGIFSSAFEQVGFENTYLKAFGWQHFEFYASGGKGISYLICRISMLPRPCIWQYTIISLLTAMKDTVTLEYGLEAPSERFSILIGKRRSLKSLQSLCPDLEETTHIIKKTHMPVGFVVLSDSAEAVERVLTQDVCRRLAENAEFFDWVICTDMVPSERYPEAIDRRIVRIVTRLPDKSRMQDIVPITTWSLDFVNIVNNVKLTDKAKVEIKKARESVMKKREIARKEGKKAAAAEQ